MGRYERFDCLRPDGYGLPDDFLFGTPSKDYILFCAPASDPVEEQRRKKKQVIKTTEGFLQDIGYTMARVRFPYAINADFVLHTLPHSDGNAILKFQGEGSTPFEVRKGLAKVLLALDFGVVAASPEAVKLANAVAQHGTYALPRTLEAETAKA